MKQVDSSGHFESDDEVGFFFEEVKSLLVSGGATVFGFHPQHIFLNTREISLYEKSKNPDLKYADLEEMISTDLVGNRVLFEDLLKLGNK